MIHGITTERRSQFDRRKSYRPIDFVDRRGGFERRKALVKDEYLRTLLDAFPSPILIVNRSMQILDLNKKAEELIGSDVDIYLRKMCGDLLHCIYAKKSKGGCGTAKYCNDCVMRKTVKSVTDGEKTFRKMFQLKMDKDGDTLDTWFLVSGSDFEYEGQNYVILTMEDVTEIVELRRLIPICAECKMVRDDNDYWQEVNKYLEKNTNIQFSHGICPQCARKLYPEFYVESD